KIVQIGAPRNVTMDTSAPAGVGDARTSGTDVFATLEGPLAPATWRLAFTTDVTAAYTVTIAGLQVPISISLEVSVEAKNIRLTQAARLDATNPIRPLLAPPAPANVALDLSITSPDPLVSQIVGPLSTVLAPVLKVALVGGALLGQQQIAQLIQGIPPVAWGVGGPAAQGVAGAPAFGPLADDIEDEILRHHLPFGTLVSVAFDQPGYGNGNIDHYEVYGDSAIWTGHYLMAEALRYELTGDPRALAGAERAAGGLDTCVGLTGERGLLSRNCVPLSSPHSKDVVNGLDAAIGTKNGVAYACENDISRDQYLGTFMGFMEAYLRVPSLRATATRVVSDMIDYLDGHQWNAYTVNPPRVWARFAPGAQTPSVVLAFLKVGNLVDRAKYGALHDRYAPASSTIWLSTWGSSREVNESYYKFNLGNCENTLLFTVETDPERYRDYARGMEILRDTVGDHQNPWFDATYAACVPSQVALWGPRVEAELQRWTLRPRRAFSIQNSSDPSIQSVVYSAPTLLQSPPHLVSRYPVPIEKRVSGCFVWQTDCFELDGSEPGTLQHSGVEFVLPYWLARSYGLID
ncbi:MAG TPA: hypothetical protein VHF22_12980, partial [Planctomycetota bacterium]|nr:hypothetical protein [Planctomycetota bacterium]